MIRFGFHGLSYEYIASAPPAQIGTSADGRDIVAHLGNGASMCAMKERKSVATTMGFTALDGLMMARRCGSIDLGIVLHLLQERGVSTDEVWRMLYQESGLLGVSGISNSVKDLEHSTEPRAREALELYRYTAAGNIGSLATALAGLDTIVFTAGIGENSAEVCRRICERLFWTGLELDNDKNTAHAARISTESSSIEVLVIPTDQEVVIAQAVQALAVRGNRCDAELPLARQPAETPG